MTIQLTTPEYWDVDGVPLNTYAYNISTLTGRTATTGLRGEDQEQAYRQGRSFRSKVADSRSITLSMWVQGFDPEVANPNASSTAQFWSNLNMLKRLFFTPRRQIALTRRWVDLGGAHTATAMGQVISPIQPSHTKDRATFVVDVFLADPFFYDDTLTSVNVVSGTPSSTTNPGDDTSPEKVTVTFTGPLTNPVLTNTSPTPDISLAYAGTINAGSSVVVDVRSCRAVLGGTTLVNNLISYTGSIWPMEVFRGPNTFTLTGGSGSATVDYRPAYL